MVLSGIIVISAPKLFSDLILMRHLYPKKFASVRDSGFETETALDLVENLKIFGSVRTG